MNAVCVKSSEHYEEPVAWCERHAPKEHHSGEDHESDGCDEDCCTIANHPDGYFCNKHYAEIWACASGTAA